MSSYKIGLKFCGGCNPRIAQGNIFREIDRLLTAAGITAEYLAPDKPGLDALLVISGCPNDCAERPPGGLPEAAVGGESVNRVSCPEKQIPARASAALAELILK